MRKKEEYTLEEFAEYTGYSESSIRYKFNSSIREKVYKETGILFVKRGRGKNARYVEEGKNFQNVESLQKNELTLFDVNSKKIININHNYLSLPNEFEFPLFFVCVLKGAYSGTPQEVLSYIDYPNTKRNREKILESIKVLMDKKILFGAFDPTDEEHFLVALTSAAQGEYSFTIELVKLCKKLVGDKRKMLFPMIKFLGWILKYEISGIAAKKSHLFKGVEVAKELDISYYQLRECRDILVKEEIASFAPKRDRVKFKLSDGDYYQILEEDYKAKETDQIEEIYSCKGTEFSLFLNFEGKYGKDFFNIYKQLFERAKK